MARTKARAHTYPDVPGKLNRAGSMKTPLTSIASLAREKPACATDPSVVPITFDWISEPIKRAACTQQTRDLRKAQVIITARLNGRHVNEYELKWAKALAMREQELYEAENATISADSEGYPTVINRTDKQGLPRVRYDTRKPSSSSTPLTATNLAALDSDSDNISDLSSVTDVSDLNPSSHGSPRAPLTQTHLAACPRSASTPFTSKNTPIASILSTLRYEPNPSDRPPWLTGLPKPFYHPSLNAEQNYEFKQRFYFDEIERLEQLRPGNDWVFEHFGSTMQVSKVGGGVREDVFARGVWKKMVEGKVGGQRLDEWPMDPEGEPLGWAIKGDLEEYRTGRWVVGSAERVGNEDEWEDVEMDEDDWEDVED